MPLAKKYCEYTKTKEIIKAAHSQDIPPNIVLTNFAKTATTPNLPSNPAIPTRVPIQIKISQPVVSFKMSSHVRHSLMTQANTAITAMTVACKPVIVVVDHNSMTPTKIAATFFSIVVIGPSLSNSSRAIAGASGVSLISGG